MSETKTTTKNKINFTEWFEFVEEGAGVADELVSNTAGMMVFLRGGANPTTCVAFGLVSSAKVYFVFLHKLLIDFLPSLHLPLPQSSNQLNCNTHWHSYNTTGDLTSTIHCEEIEPSSNAASVVILDDDDDDDDDDINAAHKDEKWFLENLHCDLYANSDEEIRRKSTVAGNSN